MIPNGMTAQTSRMPFSRFAGQVERATGSGQTSSRLPHQITSFYGLHFEDWHRPLTHNSPFAQQMPLQQVSPDVHEVVPQQMLAVGAQKGVEHVAQHFWPEGQELLPQHVLPAGAQKGVGPVVQQVWPELQEVVPQQTFPFGTQNGVEQVVQQVWLLLQDVVPQQTFPFGAQNGSLQEVQQIWVDVVQQTPPDPHAVVPLLHFDRFDWPAACLMPTALRMPPASAPPRSLSAWRRGNGLARIRAMSSRRKCTFPVLSSAQTFLGQCCDGVRSHSHVLQDHAIFTNQEGYGGSEDPVFLRQLPFVLQNHRKSDSELLRLPAIFAGIAAADHYEIQPVLAVTKMQTRQMRRQLIARSTVRITENQQHPPAAIIVQRDGAAMNIGEPERGRRRAGFEPIPDDAAFAERLCARQAPGIAPVRCRGNRATCQSRNVLGTHGAGPCHSSFPIE